jgi:hypothetical protein
MNTVQSLRKQGYKLKISHFRYIEGADDGNGFPSTELVPMYEIRNLKCQSKILPRGGRTEVELTTPSGENYKSVTYCNSVDSFNRKIGIQIAIGRILKKIESDNLTITETKPIV